MSATTWIVRLYPAPLRERWGPDLEGEAGAGGLRRLPDLLIGALDMWAHPVVWPADTPAQRRRRATVLAFVVGLGGWLIGHLAVQELDLPATMTHSWSLDLSDVLLLAGLLLVTPLPRRRTELGRLVRQSARRVGGAANLAAGRVLRGREQQAEAVHLRVGPLPVHREVHGERHGDTRAGSERAGQHPPAALGGHAQSGGWRDLHAAQVEAGQEGRALRVRASHAGLKVNVLGAGGAQLRRLRGRVLPAEELQAAERRSRDGGRHGVVARVAVRVVQGDGQQHEVRDGHAGRVGDQERGVHMPDVLGAAAADERDGADGLRAQLHVTRRALQALRGQLSGGQGLQGRLRALRTAHPDVEGIDLTAGRHRVSGWGRGRAGEQQQGQGRNQGRALEHEEPRGQQDWRFSVADGSGQFCLT